MSNQDSIKVLPLCFDNLKDPKEYFKLIKLVGTGTYGSVFRGLHLQSQMPVAVKVMAFSKQMLNDNKNELEILQKYSKHQNIARFYGAFIAKDPNSVRAPKLWVVMEYCGGGTAQDVIRYYKARGEKLKESWAVYIVEGILQGLDYLHQHGVMHRDIKSQNVMLSKLGIVKLVDFGVSAQLNSQASRSRTVIGTPYWIAPEVLRCKNNPKASYDCRCDIWSVGITAIELTESFPPLSYMDPAQAMAYIQTCVVPPTLKNPKARSQEYNTFITYCLRLDYRTRPTAEQLLKERLFIKIEMKRSKIITGLMKIISGLKVTQKKAAENIQADIKETNMIAKMISAESGLHEVNISGQENEENESDLSPKVSCSNEMKSISSNEMKSVSSNEVKSKPQMNNLEMFNTVTENCIRRTKSIMSKKLWKIPFGLDKNKTNQKIIRRNISINEELAESRHNKPLFAKQHSVIENKKKENNDSKTLGWKHDTQLEERNHPRNLMNKEERSKSEEKPRKNDKNEIKKENVQEAEVKHKESNIKIKNVNLPKGITVHCGDKIGKNLTLLCTNKGVYAFELGKENKCADIDLKKEIYQIYIDTNHNLLICIREQQRFFEIYECSVRKFNTLIDMKGPILGMLLLDQPFINTICFSKTLTLVKKLIVAAATTHCLTIFSSFLTEKKNFTRIMSVPLENVIPSTLLLYQQSNVVIAFMLCSKNAYTVDLTKSEIKQIMGIKKPTDSDYISATIVEGAINCYTKDEIYKLNYDHALGQVVYISCHHRELPMIKITEDGKIIGYENDIFEVSQLSDPFGLESKVYKHKNKLPKLEFLFTVESTICLVDENNRFSIYLVIRE